jgi:hypothetical protein
MLFNLRDDIGEATNLAAQKPQLVTELDALIDTFLSETKAVVPIPNPAFDPAMYHPELEGKLTNWAARDCKAVVSDGIAHITHIGDPGFLMFPASKHSGASTATFRIKAKARPYRLDWGIPRPIEANERSTRFTLKGGDWQEVTVPIPAEGPLGIVRLYLSKQEQPVEIDWFEIKSGNGERTRMEF